MKIVVTGCSRGIGLEFIKQAFEYHHQSEILAIARNAEGVKELVELRKKYPKQLSLLSSDVTSQFLPQEMMAMIQHWDYVDLLVNNAGILTEGATVKDFEDNFRVNAIAPFVLTQTLLPLLKNSRKAKVVSISSRMGSIEDNHSGGYYTYRSSKAALNMIMKSMALDHPWLTTAVIHPGWVQTAMGGNGATIAVETSVKGIWKVTDTLSPAQSGQFFDYLGNSLPW